MLNDAATRIRAWPPRQPHSTWRYRPRAFAPALLRRSCGRCCFAYTIFETRDPPCDRISEQLPVAAAPAAAALGSPSSEGLTQLTVGRAYARAPFAAHGGPRLGLSPLPTLVHAPTHLLSLALIYAFSLACTRTHARLTHYVSMVSSCLRRLYYRYITSPIVHSRTVAGVTTIICRQAVRKGLARNAVIARSTVLVRGHTQPSRFTLSFTLSPRYRSSRPVISRRLARSVRY